MFRKYSDYDARFQLALELPTVLPEKLVILRWLGENVGLLIIPMSLFIINCNNYPVLPHAHQRMAQTFLARTNCKIALKASDDDHPILQKHVNYLRNLYEENAKRGDPMAG